MERPADLEPSPDSHDGDTDARGQAVRRVEVSRLEQFSGPLPPPAVFRQYEQVQPGFAERIMRMTEKELDHQISMDQAQLKLRDKLLDAEIRAFTRAQWFTFALVCAFLTIAGVSVYKGQPLGAIAGGLAALGTIVYVLYGRRNAEREADSPEDAVDSEDPVRELPA